MIPATVRWFDGQSGQGMVRLGDGRSVYVHFTAIDGVSKNNHEWPTLEDQARLKSIGGMPCTVEVFEDTTFIQISRLVLKRTAGEVF